MEMFADIFVTQKIIRAAGEGEMKIAKVQVLMTRFNYNPGSMSPVREILRDSSGDSGSESDGASLSSRSSRSGSRESSNVRSQQHEVYSAPASPDSDAAAVSPNHSAFPSRIPASPVEPHPPVLRLSAPASPDGSNASGSHASRSTSHTELNKLDGSHKSGSPSPARSGSRRSSAGSVRSEKSGSPRSRSGSASSAESQKSPRSRSQSPNGSVRSSSPKSPGSSRSAHSERRSAERESKTPASPASNASSYESRKSRRSRSASSHRSNKSGSASPAERKRTESVDSEKSNNKRSKSKSPENDKSDNESNKSTKEADQSPKSDKSEDKSLKLKRQNSGSGSDTEKTIKRVKALVDSDSDNDAADKEANVAQTADALFGDASDISTDDEKDKREEEKERSRSRSRSRSKSRSRSRSRSRGRSESGGEGPSNRVAIEDDEDKDREEEPEPPPETRIDVEIPKITTDLGREIHFVKLPNFLSVETRPFDHETYEDEIDEEETLDEEGRARLKLKVENTLRWKDTFNDEGKLVKESNARFVKWSDGSMSLHLGSEIFDVYKQPLQGDHNHLYIRQGTGLQGQAVFRTKFTFRPHSTESFTHRKMTMSLADRSQKTSGIKVLSQVGMNPDQNRYEMIKKEEEKLRMAMRVQNKTKKSTGTRNTNRTSGAYSGDAYHDDGSDDEGAISLAAIKNKYKKAAVIPSKASNIYSSDEEGSDIETHRPKKNIKGKILKDSDEESSSGSTAGSGDDNQADDASD
ncbi:another transcription unit protein isoform X2 [Pseudomyrmex gracilis]|uniref:another transcription unit protein isoform X2 n=1 Tax=Pseudomyrmex gracilis TaxID=219809 RepID=UPI000995A1F8|nr:another transcription unit protein isoform X2 [Pseudomyrmex gracilis]